MLALHYMTQFENLIKESKIIEKALYEDAGIVHRTWKKRLLEPWKLTCEEVVNISKILRIEPAELFKLISDDFSNTNS